MKAVEYVKIAEELLRKPPLKSAIWDGVPPGEDGPADQQDVVFEIIRRLMNEVKPIAFVRKATTTEAIGAIMKELRQKWFAICDRMEHPLFERSCFDKFCEVLAQKTEAHQEAEKKRQKRGPDARRA